ncbi:MULTISPECIES: fused MFS/spermidine synthase [unclassified Arthrobacter]|uniref:spermidine synthase n=1 Tax=unclassified Arthrobacter TaxID=235627 RepID=UPI001E4625DD|nr:MULTISPECIES: fused MFS/spermidine synthase [unclassified Arthrobacter]MCC9144125.1 fused MFS/spermidine synthase [Arthrobacter sp. zg-Y919]MDK1275350.1 fused MFS/spermidine synthase [Arthrobacter sp. zg.Y919]WIB03261.1 fused MFS/spermidine synthase [Arthrobacter sp. zg-Y919]
MGRKRPGKDPVEAAAGTGPVAGTYPIDTGTCELVPDSLSPDGWILMVNGVHSSHIDLADPRHLDFEYMRWIAALVESRWRPDASLRALHLGAAACSLARYFSAVYPGARQVAVELDGRLAELVRGWFDLPRAPLLRLRVGEARAVTETLHEDSRDLVIRDVFAGAKTPVPLTTAEFTAHVARVLAPGGVYVVNCGDTPDLRGARAEAATICAAFEYTAAIADPAMLKGRRYGNIILAGSDTPFAEDPSLPRALLGGAVPAHLWADEKVRSFAAGSRPLHDAVEPAERPVGTRRL